MSAPKLTIVERRKFIKRNQLPDENISANVLALKHLSRTRKFGEKLDEQLRDRFISGLKNETTALKLMEKSRDKSEQKFQEAV